MRCHLGLVYSSRRALPPYAARRTPPFPHATQVREAVWDHYQLLYGIFDYFVVVYNGQKAGIQEGDVNLFEMSFLAFSAVAREGGFLAGSPPYPRNGIQLAALDLIFAEIVATTVTKEEDVVAAERRGELLQEEADRRLGRHLSLYQFLEAVVRIAIIRCAYA